MGESLNPAAAPAILSTGAFVKDSDPSEQYSPCECLLISYHFRNEGTPSAHHLMDRLPIMANQGIRFRLLNSLAAVRADDFPQVRIPPLFPGEVRYLLRLRMQGSSLPRALRGLAWQMAFLPLWPLFLLERLLPFRDFTLSWWMPAAAAGVVSAWRRRPDVVFSFGGRPNAHLAAWVVSRICRLPWVAQVQDPLVLEGFAKNRLELKFMRGMEKLMMKRAHRVVFMTNTAREEAEHRCGTPGKGFTNYAGFDRSWFAEGVYSKGEVMRILHAGTLGGSRTPGPFLQALSRMARETPEVRDRIHLDLAGSVTGAAEGELRAFPLPGMLTFHGPVGRTRLYGMMASADVLLLIQNRDPYSSQVINAKVYEYLFSGRPILGLVYRNPELAGLLRGWGHEAVELEDVDGIAKSLSSLLSVWRQDGLPTRFPDDLPTASDSAHRLANLLRQAASGAQKGDDD